MNAIRSSAPHKLRSIFAPVLLLGALLLGLAAGPAESATFAPGDLFVSVANGKVIWYRPVPVADPPTIPPPPPTLVTILNTGLGGFATGMAFDATGNLYVTNFNADAVVKFTNNSDPAGTPPVKFGRNYNRFPESIVFDAAGNAYVGQAEGNRNILKLDPAGNLLARFNVATEVRGSDWIDLTTSGCTIYYTSEGTHVKRFDASTGTQLDDLPVTLPGLIAFALALLPGTGDILVADTDQIRLLSAGPAPTYAAGQRWFALSLDPTDSTVFWAGDQYTGTVTKFRVYTGDQILSFNTSPAGAGTFVSGLAVFPNLPPAPKGQGCPGAPPPRQTGPRMTGGGSVFTAESVRVTQGFELHCNPAVGPNNLEVNWGQGNNFHLEALTSALCTDDPNIAPNPPSAGFDTYQGKGIGRYNGVSGATASWTFTDAGEPGTNDSATLLIKDAEGNTVLDISGELNKGNQQAHKN